MGDSFRPQLEKAYELIKAGHKTEARKVLVDVLRADATVVDAYWLWSLAAETPDEAREALEEILYLSPGHKRAQDALARLNQRHPARKPGTPETEDDKPVADERGAPTEGEGSKRELPLGPVILIAIGLVILVAAVLIVLGNVQIGPCHAQEWLNDYYAVKSDWQNLLNIMPSSQSTDLLEPLIDRFKEARSAFNGLGSRPCARPVRNKAVKIVNILIDITEKTQDFREESDPKKQQDMEQEIYEMYDDLNNARRELAEEEAKLQQVAREEAQNP
jgi:hypothetical protein